MNIVKNRFTFYSISLLMVVLSLGAILSNGFNYGIDFTGGSLIEIQVKESLPKETIEQKLSGMEKSSEIVGAVRVQPTTPGIFIIRTRELNDEAHKKVSDVLSGLEGYKELGFTRIGPVVGEDLKSKAWYAVFFAMVFMVVYIAWAFRAVPKSVGSLRFGVVAILALLHDVLITAGVFALMGYEIDSFFITAILTVFGFSVNDTIVVFDRVRETLIRRIHSSLEETAEYSIQSTLIRSFNTSMTVLIMLFSLYFITGSELKHFLLALIIGIGVGTYSSIFIATPLLVTWEEWFGTGRKLAMESDAPVAGKKKKK